MVKSVAGGFIENTRGVVASATETPSAQPYELSLHGEVQTNVPTSISEHF
jgi:hypothetical protein